MATLHDVIDLLFGTIPFLVVLGFCLLLGWAVAVFWLGSRPSALDAAHSAIDAGDYDEARVWAERAVQRARKDLDLAAALDALGAVHRFAGENTKAEECYRRALDLRGQNLEPGDGDLGISLCNVALSLVCSGRHAEAEPLYRQAVTTLRRAGGRHADVALALVGLGHACLFTGKLDESAELLERSLRITQRVFGRDHPRTAEALMHKAATAADSGRFHQSDLAYRECRAVREQVDGPDHPATLIAEQQHANLLLHWTRLTGDAATLAEAEGLAERVVERTRVGLGAEHQLAASGLRTLAAVRTLQHRPAEAVELAREALRVIEAALGPDHMRCGVKRMTLAQALDEAGDLAEAEEHAARALAVCVKVFGPDHVEIGDPHEVLGRLAARQGRFADAEEHLRRSLSLREPLGRTHPVRAFTLRELALLLRQTDRIAEAERAEQEVDSILTAARMPGGPGAGPAVPEDAVTLADGVPSGRVDGRVSPS
jgi:tetratricopeptide (TPR) repeat protein